MASSVTSTHVFLTDAFIGFANQIIRKYLRSLNIPYNFAVRGLFNIACTDLQASRYPWIGMPITHAFVLFTASYASLDHLLGDKGSGSIMNIHIIGILTCTKVPHTRNHSALFRLQSLCKPW